jgi:hypothetical protein
MALPPEAQKGRRRGLRRAARRKPPPVPRGATPEAARAIIQGKLRPRPTPKLRPAPAPTTPTRAGGRQPEVQRAQARKVARARPRPKPRPAKVDYGGGQFDPSMRLGPGDDTAAKRAARKIGKPITLGSDQHYYVKVKRRLLPDRLLPINPRTAKVDRGYMLTPGFEREAGGRQQAAIHAPATKVLEQTQRPIHGVAGGTRAAIRGESVPRAVGRGLALKDRYRGSDVLKAAGVKNKAVREVGGFIFDVGADPTTYITGGTGAVATRAGTRAATRVERKARRAGLTAEQARRAGQRAAKRAERKAPRGRGVTVAIAGREVPAVRRGTAAVARGTRRGTRRAVGERVSQTAPAVARSVVREVAPRVAPAGVRREQHMIARAQTRRARATTSAGAERAQMLERELLERMTEGDRARVIDALERNKLSRVIGPTTKAREKLRREDPGEYRRRQELVRVVHDVRSSLGGRRSLRAGARPRERPEEFLRAQDLRKLQRSVVAEQTAQRRGLVRAGRQETRARERALLTEREAELRHGGREAVQEVRERGRARLEQAQLAGRARVATQGVRGREAQRVAVQTERARGRARLATERARSVVGRQAAVDRQRAIARAREAHATARARLRRELAKPVTKRRGVAALEARVAQTRRAWQQARAPVARPRVEPVAARAVEPAVQVSAIRPQQRPVERVRSERAVGAREGRAAERYERRAATTLQQQRQLEAAQGIPERSLRESPEQYLKRVRAHAVRHNLPLVKRRAETLLASKPERVARGYFPREVEERLNERLSGGFVERLTRTRGPEPTMVGQGRTVRRTTAGYARKDVRPLDVVNRERLGRGEAPFSTDVPLVVGNHLREAARATSQGEFAQNMAAAVGRPVRRREDLLPGEELYKLGHKGRTFGLHKVSSVPKGGRGGGQYVAMPSGFFEQMQFATRGTATDNPLGMIFDRLQGGWKRVATASLAFHVRNLIGDVQAGYYAPGAGGAIGKIPAATRAVARTSQQARMLRPPATNATIRVAGRQVGLDEFLKGARDNGVLDAGIIAREVREIGAELPRTRARGGRTAVTRAARRGGRAVDRWLTNRENIMRLAAYKHGLDRGMKPAEAADMANLFHIDYTELSRTERAFMRRAMPFYTWSARSLPVAGLTLIQKPGKFANLEKLRQDISIGLTGEDEETLRERQPEFVARQLPVTVRVGGSDYAVSASIPATLLNEIPADTDIGAYLDEISHFGVGMITPLVKAPTELYFNQSAFTKRPVEDEERPLTPAPQWISLAPEWVQRMTGAVPDYRDPTTGRRVWGWRGRADWFTRQVPGLPQQVSAAAAGGRPGQEQLPTPAAIGSQLGGVRLDKLGAETAKRAAAARERESLAALERRAGALNQRGVNSDNPTPEYRRLRQQINALEKRLYPSRRGAARRGGGGGGFGALRGGGGGGGGGGSEFGALR